MNEKNTNVIETVEIDQAMGVMPEEVDPGMSVMPGPGVADTPTVIPELDPMFAVALDQLPAYTTTDWKNKPSTATPVTAEIMKKIEQRLVDLTNAYNNQEAEIKTLRDSVSRAVAFNAKKFEMKEGGKMRLTFSDRSIHSGGLIFSTGNGTPWYGVIGRDSSTVGNVTVTAESLNTFLVKANAWNYGVIIPISGTVVVEPA